MEELSEILKKLDTGNTSKENKISNVDKNISIENTCENCSDQGWITNDLPIDHPNFGKPFICDCQQAQINLERTKRLLKYSNLGYLHKANFNNTNPKGINNSKENSIDFDKAFKDSLKFTENPNGWLVFTGPTGSGKTMCMIKSTEKEFNSAKWDLVNKDCDRKTVVIVAPRILFLQKY